MKLPTALLIAFTVTASTVDGAGLTIDGFLASRDGRILLRRSETGAASDPEELGRRLAHVLLDECGGRSLDDWVDDRVDDRADPDPGRVGAPRR